MTSIGLGPQTCTTPAEGARREWLVTDGLGGYAMGTVAGLRTRRYHGLLVVATDPPGGRHLALASLDPVLVVGDTRIRLGTHRWADGTLAPTGFEHLAAFTLADGVPRWRWQVGEVILDREVAMVHGRPAVAISHRLVAGPSTVRLELEALCTWRDAHGERVADGTPDVEAVANGCVVEGRYRIHGPGFTPAGCWYRGVRHDEEAARGLPDHEDLFLAGRFTIDLAPSANVDVTAWADDLEVEPPPATEVITAAHARARGIAGHDGVTDHVDRLLAVAADQFVTAGPTVVAGYPWFGDWSRDTMISYEGLLLATGRAEQGRALLRRAAADLSQGMLSNTADSGEVAYNTADATLWFVHAVGRHVELTGDDDLANELLPHLDSIVDHHVAGTRHGITIDPTDGLLRQGEPGLALTWMDARINAAPVTPRAGKAVEINALWINALGVIAALHRRQGLDPTRWHRLREQARLAFGQRFVADGDVRDVVDGPDGNDGAIRPNALLAVSLPYAPLRERRTIVERCARALLTPLGLRSLAPRDPAYLGQHRGDQPARDRAYHQGTVWPWLIGAYVDAAQRVGVPVEGILEPLERHLQDWGLGSVSETADGDPPHSATGCPFQAWSVAELLRARRLVAT